MRVVDVWQAIPFTILAIAVAVILGPSLRNVILVLGISSWVQLRARRPRRDARPAQQRDRAQRAGHRRGSSTDPAAPRPAPGHREHHRAVLAARGEHDPVRGLAQLPRPRRSAATPSWGNMVLDGVEPIRVAVVGLVLPRPGHPPGGDGHNLVAIAARTRSTRASARLRA